MIRNLISKFVRDVGKLSRDVAMQVVAEVTARPPQAKMIALPPIATVKKNPIAKPKPRPSMIGRDLQAVATSRSSKCPSKDDPEPEPCATLLTAEGSIITATRGPDRTSLDAVRSSVDVAISNRLQAAKPKSRRSAVGPVPIAELPPRSHQRLDDVPIARERGDVALPSYPTTSGGAQLSKFHAKRDRAWLDSQPHAIEVVSYGYRKSRPSTFVRELRSRAILPATIEPTFMRATAKVNIRYRHAMRSGEAAKARKRTFPQKSFTRELMHRLEFRTNETMRDFEHLRPKTRGDCIGGIRPCPWISCTKHLLLDVNPLTGSITFNFPGKDFDEIAQTCSIDVGEDGAKTLEEVGAVMNLTRERIRQIEMIAYRTPAARELAASILEAMKS